MNIQRQYWKFMVQVKSSIIYLEKYYTHCCRIDMWINIAMALTSCSALGAWAVANKGGAIWSVIIILSQIINCIKYLFPFQKRIVAIPSAQSRLSQLYEDIEMHWLFVSNGSYSEQEINDVLYKMKNEYVAIENRELRDKEFSIHRHINHLSSKEADEYFRRVYDV